MYVPGLVTVKDSFIATDNSVVITVLTALFSATGVVLVTVKESINLLTDI